VVCYFVMFRSRSRQMRAVPSSTIRLAGQGVNPSAAALSYARPTWINLPPSGKDQRATPLPARSYHGGFGTFRRFSLRDTGAAVAQVAFSLDVRQLVSADADGTILFWDGLE